MDLVTTREALQRAHAAQSAELASARNRLAGRMRSLKRRILRSARAVALAESEAQWAAKTAQAESRYRGAIREAERDCVALALAVCRGVVGELAPNAVTNLSLRITEALSRLASRGLATVTVHESQKARIAEALSVSGGVKSGAASGTDYTVRAGDVTPGNAVIETTAGSITIDWETQYNSIATRLEHESELYSDKSIA